MPKTYRILLIVVLNLRLWVDPASSQVPLFGPERAVLGGFTAHEPVACFPADIDGDGDLDVLVGQLVTYGKLMGQVVWYETRDDPGIPVIPHPIDNGENSGMSVHAADLDNDGDMDVLSAVASQFKWYENLEGSPPAFEHHVLNPSAGQAACVFARDLDGDGDQDVFGAGDSAWWYENLGGGEFMQHLLDASPASSIFAEDMDGDEDIDILVAGSTVKWFENDGAESFTGHTLEGGGRTSIWAARIDADEDMDVVVGGATLAWYDNQGSGSFSLITLNSTQIDCIHPVDVDGDGDIDILSAQASFYWYENNGAASFSQRIIATSGRDPSSIYGVDMNDDDHCDVVHTLRGDCHGRGCEACQVSVNINIGTSPPGFSPHVIASGISELRETYAADLDNDTDIDIVSFDRQQIFWHESNGEDPPGFNGHLNNSSAGARDNPLVFADIDGDNDPDALTLVRGNSTRISWIANSGFNLAGIGTIDLVPGFDSVRGIAPGDLDDDGHMDVLSAGNSILWHENDGNPSPSFSRHIIAASRASSVLPSDLDMDGDLDVLAASKDDNRVEWYENDGNVVFAVHEILSIFVNRPVHSHSVDLDKDGDTDLVSASEKDHKIAWFENDGSIPPTYIPHEVSTTALSAQAVFAADIDSDGNIDLLSASGSDDKVAWYKSDGQSPPSFETRIIDLSANQAESVYAIDLDGDGDTDVLSASSLDNTVAWYENDGGLSPNFEAHPITTSALGAVSVFAGDLDHDGDVDVLSASNVDDMIVWYENSGAADPTFDPHTITSTANGAWSVYASDVDSDGDLDVLSASTFDRTIAWYENDGNENPTFQFHIISTAAEGARSVFARDVDMDGDVDVISGSLTDNKVAWYRNDGGMDPAFEEELVSVTSQDVESVLADDIDGDGDTDIVSVSSGDSKIAWYENDGAISPSFQERFVAFSPVRQPQDMRVADLDGDLDMDFLTVDSDAIIWFTNNGETPPSFSPSVLARASQADPSDPSLSFCLVWPWCQFEVADIDQDGDVDVLSGSYSTRGGVLWFENDGSPTPHFETRFVDPIGNWVTGLEFVDFDGDHDLDLLFGTEDNPDRVGWIENLLGEIPTETPTSTATITPTPTSTPTITSTPTVTETLVATFTSTPNPTTTSTPTASSTSTPTNTPEPTQTEEPDLRSDIDLDRDVDDYDLFILAHDWHGLKSATSEEPVDYRTTISTAAEFEDNTIEGGGRFDILREGKYWSPVIADETDFLPTVYQNVNLHPFHPDFLQTVFPDRFAGFSLDTLFSFILRDTPRQYFAGGIFSFESGDGSTVYGFDSVADYVGQGELLTQEEAGFLYHQLSETFLLRPFAYSPIHQLAIQEAETWSSPGFPIYLPGDSIEVAFEAYTVGTNYGRVRILTLEQLEAANSAGTISWQDILVLDQSPFDIQGVQAAVITGSRQGELSHVALRTARRGTPNAFVKDPHDAFAPFEGQLVRITVTEDTYSIDVNVTLEEATAWWAANRPTIPDLTEPDLEHAAIENVLEMDVDESEVPLSSRYGGKAAGLAKMYSFLPAQYQVPAFGLPFRYYREFMTSNSFNIVLDGSIHTLTYQEYVEYLLQDPLFLTDGTYRASRLKVLRDSMEDDGVVDPALIASLVTQVEEVFGQTSIMVRSRSSSNTEDSIFFNGAGLYESTSVCVEDSLDSDSDGPSHCDPNQPKERSIERGLRKVWASLWNFRAYEEREYFQIPQDRAAMAVLFTLAFPDEASNGVAFTGDPIVGADAGYVINVQIGDNPTVQPDIGVLPELDILEMKDGQVINITRARGSTLVNPGENVLTDDQLRTLGAAMAIVDASMPLDLGDQSREDVLLDIEFKFNHEGDLFFKQVRPFLRSNLSDDGAGEELLSPRSDINQDGIVNLLDLGFFLGDRRDWVKDQRD